MKLRRRWVHNDQGHYVRPVSMSTNHAPSLMPLEPAKPVTGTRVPHPDVQFRVIVYNAMTGRDGKRSPRFETYDEADRYGATLCMLKGILKFGYAIERWKRK